jgi:ABC-2 type transport system ATP-binding protein
MDAMRPVEVAVVGLSKRYPGGVEAVRGIDFAVHSGEVFGLLGPNGAGKSTTIGMLTTTVVPSSGTAHVAGFDVAREPIEARRVTAVVTQDAAVDRALSGRRNLEIHARLWRVDHRQARIAEVVDWFGLGEIIERAVGEYSGGQRRRLELARALVSRPRVLFLDEPTVGLDPRVRHELLDLIAGLARGGDMTIVLTTHQLDEAEQLCDRVAFMDHGRIAAMDSPKALLDRLGSRVVELRVAGDASAAMASLRASGLADDNAFSVGQTLAVPLHGTPPADVIAAVSALGLSASEITTRPPTLDDVYLHLTGNRLAA